MVGFGDNIGSGFTKIMNAWNELGFPAPTIRQEDEVDEVWLTLPLPSGFPIFIASHGTVNPTEDPVNSIDGTVNGTVNSADGTVNGTVNSADGTVNGSKMSFTSTQNAILSVLANNPEITADAVCTELNISRRTVLRAYKSLQETGMLIRVGSDKTGRWIVNINNNKN